jgi:hypothetical protein
LRSPRAEIVTAAESLTLPGYTVAQTRREVAPMIEGAVERVTSYGRFLTLNRQ